MDTNAILMAVLGGGAGGALGGLIAGLLARPLSVDWRRWIVIAGVVACSLIGARLAPIVAHALNPAPAIASIETELQADPALGPMLAAWRARDPASYAAFIARVSEGVVGAARRPAAIERARVELIAASRPRLAYLDDASQVEMIRLARDQMRELAASHPIACHPLFHGRRFGDIAPYFSEDLRQREMTLLTEAFRADPASPRAALQGEALNATIAAVVNDTRATFGEDIALIAPDAAIEGREPRVCEAAAALYDQMQALPEPQAAALMRGLTALSG